LYGWIGKIIRINLSDGKTSNIPTSNYVPRLIGGWGIAAKIAWDELPPEIGAFDTENRLMFMTGPLTGTLFPATGRVEISTISPVTYSFDGPTEDYVRSGIGGHWGPELKFAGYDGIIVQGRAETPSYVYINDDSIEIRDAKDLWGLDTYSTQEAIWKNLKTKKAQVMCIGPGGENLVRFATIATHNGNQAAVGGVGAVMGSKNLKAIAIRGTGSVETANPDKFYALAHKLHKYRLRAEARPPYGLYGIGQHRMGHGGAIMNKLLLEHWKKDTMKGTACWGCPIGCFVAYSVPDAIKPGISNCCSGISFAREAGRNFYGQYTKDYVKVTGLMDGYGIDQRGFSQTINWLRGCYEKELLSEKETNISLRDYGSYEFYERLLTQISDREDFGDKLAEGVHRASDALGNLGREFINDINRGFAESYSPRLLPTSAFLAAFESSQRLTLYHTWSCRILFKHCEEPQGRGWLTNEEWTSYLEELFGTEKIIDHSDEGYYQPDKAYLAKWTEDFKTFSAGCLITCDWVGSKFFSWYSDRPHRQDNTPEAHAEAYSLVTGLDMSLEEMLKAGERVRNLERAIMVREGRRRKDDTLADYCFSKPEGKIPPYMGKVPGPDGHWIEVNRKIDREKWEKLKDVYYEIRGWDPKTGIPTRDKLLSLDLRDIADDLKKLNLQIN
jgi:aldehyde:ferredoxin oxidoreductase